MPRCSGDDPTNAGKADADAAADSGMDDSGSSEDDAREWTPAEAAMAEQ